MRRLYFAIITAIFLQLVGCSRSDEATTSRAVIQQKDMLQNSKIVDAKEYFSNLPAFENQHVFLYLRRVYAPPRETADKNVIQSGDPRYISPYGYLKIANNVMDAWVNAGLDPDRQYTATFGVRAKDATGGKRAIFDIEVDEFIINSDDGPRYGDETVSQSQQVFRGI